jgi:hypothetical protein
VQLGSFFIADWTQLGGASDEWRRFTGQTLEVSKCIYCLSCLLRNHRTFISTMTSNWTPSTMAYPELSYSTPTPSNSHYTFPLPFSYPQSYPNTHFPNLPNPLHNDGPLPPQRYNQPNVQRVVQRNDQVDFNTPDL